MYLVDLFLGFEISKDFQNALSKANPHLVQTFINNESMYLHRTSLGGKSYLGKFVGQSSSLKQIELFTMNIKSLVKRITPQHPIENEPFLLLSKTKDEQ